MEEFQIQNGDITLAGVRWPGDGPAMVCLHGLAANVRQWDRLAENLAGRVDLIAFDLRGRGFSSKPESGYGPDAHLSDTLAVADHFGLDRFVLCGYSMGAMASIHIAATRPERLTKLVLIDGGAKVPTEVADGLRPVIRRLGKVYESREYMVENYRHFPPFHPWTSYHDRFFERDIETLPDGRASSRVYSPGVTVDIKSLGALDFPELYRRVPVPTLLVHATRGILGETDLILPPASVEAMRNGFADLTTHEVAGANHYSMALGDYPEIAEEIAGFVCSLPNQSPDR